MCVISEGRFELINDGFQDSVYINAIAVNSCMLIKCLFVILRACGYSDRVFAAEIRPKDGLREDALPASTRLTACLYRDGNVMIAPHCNILRKANAQDLYSQGHPPPSEEAPQEGVPVSFLRHYQLTRDSFMHRSCTWPQKKLCCTCRLLLSLVSLIHRMCH